ncbi:hypothetical protein V8B97DRAFT_2025998 [Scleroderma yunnanense]
MTLTSYSALLWITLQEPKQGRHNDSQPNAVAGPSRLPLESKTQIDFFEKECKESTIQILNLAFKLQETFDVEDASLRRQQAELQSHLQRKFDCGICLEECPEDDSTTVDGCGHMMCRGCMKHSIAAKIAERRFPILCPICTADNSGCSAAEMQLSQLCILLHCRKCKRAAFVDRHDYNDMSNVACPLPDCNHMHSCDGSLELDHLMKKKGWKYCPNCKIPIIKEHGCNHMTCIAPGCNTHFCYLCGALIIRSSLRDGISKAVNKHYSKKCELFKVLK